MQFFCQIASARGLAVLFLMVLWVIEMHLDRNWATASQDDRHSTPADKLSVVDFGCTATNLGVVLDGQLSMSHSQHCRTATSATSAELSQELLS